MVKLLESLPWTGRRKPSEHYSLTRCGERDAGLCRVRGFLSQVPQASTALRVTYLGFFHCAFLTTTTTFCALLETNLSVGHRFSRSKEPFAALMLVVTASKDPGWFSMTLCPDLNAGCTTLDTKSHDRQPYQAPYYSPFLNRPGGATRSMDTNSITEENSSLSLLICNGSSDGSTLFTAHLPFFVMSFSAPAA
jgi:hypothetical protein